MGSPTKIKKICEPFAMGGNKVATFSYFAGPASYTTGGDILKASDIGLTFIIAAFRTVADSADRIANPIFYQADGAPATDIKVLITDLAGTEVANASNQSTKKFRLTIIGIY